MNDYLSNLAARSLERVEVIQPRPLSLFEPLPLAAGLAFDSAMGLETAPGEEPSTVGSSEVPPALVGPPAAGLPLPTYRPAQAGPLPPPSPGPSSFREAGSPADHVTPPRAPDFFSADLAGRLSRRTALPGPEQPVQSPPPTGPAASPISFSPAPTLAHKPITTATAAPVPRPASPAAGQNTRKGADQPALAPPSTGDGPVPLVAAQDTPSPMPVRPPLPVVPRPRLNLEPAHEPAALPPGVEPALVSTGSARSQVNPGPPAALPPVVPAALEAPLHPDEPARLAPAVRLSQSLAGQEPAVPPAPAITPAPVNPALPAGPVALPPVVPAALEPPLHPDEPARLAPTVRLSQSLAGQELALPPAPAITPAPVNPARLTHLVVAVQPQIRPAPPDPSATLPPSREWLEQPAPPPTVQVTIGRIEVRAAPPPPSPARPPAAPPVLTLDEYLRQRANGGIR